LINDQVQNTQVLEKTTYKLNVALENKILRGINELEKSKDYLDSSFNINVLAKKINTNTTYLSYTINKIKNKSFKQYVTELKIEYLIKKLKIDKNYRKYTIKYLADEIGYTSASAFTRAFKKHKGITPSEFIKSLSEKN
jgi:AraC-like DNA-binding protein